MAIVKANYTKSSVNIKASIRYIQHRAGKDGQKITRTLFGIDGELEREEAYTMGVIAVLVSSMQLYNFF